MRRTAVAVSLVAACALAVPMSASANHHACPQVNTSNSGDLNLTRKDCSPVYVPYPVGGPSSPLPAGANQQTGLPLPALQTPTPPDLSNTIPGQQNPPDPLGCAGPSFAPVRQSLQGALGNPQGSSPSDPYNCSPITQSARAGGSGAVPANGSASASASAIASAIAASIS